MESFNSSQGSKVIYTVEDDIPKLIYKSLNTNTSNLKTNNHNLNIRKHYENNTYIDWSRETLLIPNNSSFLSKKWIVVTVSAILIGYLATLIDLSSVWLNDLKKGLCFSKIDKWSLLNPYRTCPIDDWYNWSRILFNSTNSITNIFINFPIYIIFALIWSFIAAYITIVKAPLIKQSGIPEIKLIISGFNFNIDNYLGLRTLIYKTFGLILVVSSGLWLGKEGPLIHVSCCVLNILFGFAFRNQYENEAVRRELLTAATATGVSVAFNAPIGGVLFVLESMPSFFMPTKIMWNSFVNATIAVIVVTGFKIFTEGTNFVEQDLFPVEFGNFSWLFMEIPPFLFLGVLGGVYGYLFTNLNAKFITSSFRKKFQFGLCHLFGINPLRGPYLEILMIVIITSILSFPFELTKLPLNAYLKSLFTACQTDSSSNNFLCQTSNLVTIGKLTYILISGFILSCYTFGTELPGGILTPSLVLGATTGRLLGIISQALQNKFNWDSLATCTEKSCIVSPSSYAVIGAAAFMSGITKFTMSVVVIIFELTGAVSYVLPIMLAVMVSKFINDWLTNDNIYDSLMKLTINKEYNSNEGGKLPPNEGKGPGLVNFSGLTTFVKNKLPDVSIKSFMIPIQKTKCICLIPEDYYTVNSLYEFANSDVHEGYPVILSYGYPVYLGYVNKPELYNKLSTIEDINAYISFQINDLPTIALSQQLHYERSISSTMIQIELEVEKSIIIFNELTTSILLMETFEKLHTNYSVIMDSNNPQVMCGFIDRFIIAEMIDSQFSSLETELNEIINVDEFDLEDYGDSERDDLLNMRRNRLSIELIN
ncbi:chloride channel [Scheffersomyces amazonensis]|uniref:chloride channel n=1 Tax=Scheffersomyces amazonensis TaxID=1078765 RepID=UPI00315D8ED0